MDTFAIAFENAAETRYSCIVCGEPMETVEQPALLPSQESTTLVTCSNPECPARGFTYDSRDIDGEPVEDALPDATLSPALDVCPTCGFLSELNGAVECHDCQIENAEDEAEEDNEPLEVRLRGGYDTQLVSERNRMERFLR